MYLCGVIGGSSGAHRMAGFQDHWRLIGCSLGGSLGGSLGAHWEAHCLHLVLDCRPHWDAHWVLVGGLIGGVIGGSLEAHRINVFDVFVHDAA